jgi:hypothetical protein
MAGRMVVRTGQSTRDKPEANGVEIDYTAGGE